MQKQPYNARNPSVIIESQPWFDPITFWIARPAPLFSGTRNIHCHSLLEIGYCISGSGVYYIRNEIYTISPGDIAIVYPGENHDARTISSENSLWRFLFIRVPEMFRGWQNSTVLEEITSARRYQGRVCTRQESRRLLPCLLRILELYDESEICPPDYIQIRMLLACMLYETRPFLPHFPSKPNRCSRS